MMLAIGVGIRSLAGPLRDRLPVFSALVLVAIGLYSLSGGIQKDPAKVAMRARHMVPASLATPAPAASPTAMPTATPDSAQPPSEHRP
jgi:Ni,Fe-hydrogenase III small subunit